MKKYYLLAVVIIGMIIVQSSSQLTNKYYSEVTKPYLAINVPYCCKTSIYFENDSICVFSQDFYNGFSDSIKTETVCRYIVNDSWLIISDVSITDSCDYVSAKLVPWEFDLPAKEALCAVANSTPGSLKFKPGDLPFSFPILRPIQDSLRIYGENLIYRMVIPFRTNGQSDEFEHFIEHEYILTESNCTDNSRPSYTKSPIVNSYRERRNGELFECRIFVETNLEGTKITKISATGYGSGMSYSWHYPRIKPKFKQ